MKDVTQPVRARGTMLSAVALVAALAALLALAPFASAASDPLASGTTTLTLNKSLFKKLKKSGVKLIKVSPATLKVRTLALPVLGGSLDPTNGQGAVEQSGGIKFKHGKKSAVVKELVLETTTGSLNAKVAGKKMKLASLSGVSSARNGFGANVTIGSSKLTGKAAKQLNKKLGFTGKQKKKAPFKGGKGLGSALSETQPKTVTVLPGGEASLLTNKETVLKFIGLGVNLEVVPPAKEELALPPTYFFPINGGTIAPNATSGVVQTVGGVKLTQEPFPTIVTTMTLNGIFVDLGAKTATVEVIIETNAPGVTSPGNVGRSSIADLNLVGATITSNPSTHTVSVANATATLQAVTAEVLNSTFAPEEPPGSKKHLEVFKPGDGLGTFSFTAQTQ